MLAGPAARVPAQNSGQGFVKGVLSVDILSHVADVHLNNWQTWGGRDVWHGPPSHLTVQLFPAGTSGTARTTNAPRCPFTLISQFLLGSRRPYDGVPEGQHLSSFRPGYSAPPPSDTPPNMRDICLHSLSMLCDDSFCHSRC